MPFPAMIEHPRHESAGNRALLALVDSRGSYADTNIVEQTVLVALRHFGFPHRVHDLAAAPLSRELLDGCAAVVIAQGGLGAALSAAETDLLAAAVTEAGLGLVNFDGALWLYKPSLLRLMAMEVGPLPVCSDLLRISERQHYINWTLPASGLVRLKRPVSFAEVRAVGRHVSEVAQYALGKDQLIAARHNVPAAVYEPGQFPAVLAARCGQGRFVRQARACGTASSWGTAWGSTRSSGGRSSGQRANRSSP